MKKIFFILLLALAQTVSAQPTTTPVVTTIRLPEPDLNGKVSLEQAIENRRSVSLFITEPLKISQISQLCWSAQGITDPNTGLRAAPSIGNLYPMQLYVVLPDGLYLYFPQQHTLEKQIAGDIRPMLFRASFNQQALQGAPCIFIIAGSPRILEAKFRGRSEKFLYLEAGHIAQNIQLQAVTLGLASVPIGYFDPKAVAGICRLTEDLETLYMICTGIPIVKPVLESAVAAAAPESPLATPSSDVRTKRVVIILPKEYFNDDEFFGVQDTLQLAGVPMVVASSVVGEIKGIARNRIVADILVSDIKIDDYDAFVFIGGPGVKQYFSSKEAINLIRQADEKNKILAAINNAPGVFADAGIVKGGTITSAVSQRNKLLSAGAKWRNTSVEIDGNLITAGAPDDSQVSAGGVPVARRFGTAILSLLRQPPLPRLPSGQPPAGQQGTYPQQKY